MSEDRENLNIPQSVERERIHKEAEQARNPYQVELVKIADEYSERLKKLVPESSIVGRGGSLSTQTLLKGHNEVDLRILLQPEWSSKEKIDGVSSAISGIVPFQKVYPVGAGLSERFALIHNLSLNVEGIEGHVEIDVRVRPAEGFVEFEKFESTYPQDLIDECVIFKEKTRHSNPSYQKIKKQYRAMTRWLHQKNYWDSDGNIIGKPEDFEDAKKLFWGHTPEEVLAQQ